MRPVRYGPFARAADWYQGWRDGRAGVPEPDRGVATTGHREALVRRAQDAFEHERLRLEGARAGALVRLAAALARERESTAELVRAQARLADIPPTLTAAQQRALRYREERRTAVMVRLRRTREHDRGRQAAAAQVQAAQDRVGVAAAAVAVERDAVDREIVAARTRVRRIQEHTHRRLASYRRRLVRSHPAGGWVNEIMDSRQPAMPGWAVRGVTGAVLPDGDQPPADDPPPTRADPPVDPPTEHRRRIRLGAVTRFGAQPDLVDVLVPGYGVAAVHATLRRRGAGYRLTDRGRGEGTFQDGQPVRKTWLQVGDTFTIGDYQYRLLAGDELAETLLGPYDLVVAGLNAPDYGERRLTEMSFAQRSQTVVAILGPSGAGKSSLFHALLGELALGAGALYFTGHSLQTHAAQIRPKLGFVPQDDTVHPTLTVRQALAFSDRLRQTGNLARSRPQRLAEVCAKLQLTGRLDHPVGRLSGGQRKRVSIALEVLAQPHLLMLDEPTSGLDAGMDFEVMRLLRRLSRDRDRIVLVVTHATQHLNWADEVLVVASHGRPVYFGPPDGLLAALSADSYAGLMRRLADDEIAAAAAAAYQAGAAAREARKRAAAAREAALRPPGDAARPPGPTRPRTGWNRFWHQLPVLVHRQFVLLGTRAPLRDLPAWPLARNAAVVAMPLLVPVAGGILAALVAGAGGLGVPGAAGRTALNLLVTLCMLSGQALTYSDLVAEYPAIAREHRTGAVTAAVVLAKWLVYAVVAAVQALLVTAVFGWIRPGPAYSLAGPGWLGLSLGLAGLSVAAMSAGLLVSAAAQRLEQAVAMATAVAIAQVALSGGLAELAAPMRWVAALLPSRWGFAAAASSVDLPAISAPGTAVDRLWTHSAGQWWFDLSVLGVLAVLCTAAAVAVLSRRLNRPQS